MKNLVLAIGLIALPFVVFAQLVKKANRIEIFSDTLKDFDLFSQAVLQLKEMDFTWKDIDKDFYIVTTEPFNKTGFRKDFYMVIILSVTENQISLRGKCRDKIADVAFDKMFGENYGEDWSDIKNTGMKGSLMRWAWDVFEEYAIALRSRLSGQIIYIKTE